MATPPAAVARVLELAAAGTSDAQIGAAVGISARTVIRIRQRHSAPSAWRPRRTALCGFPGRYRRGCRCPICRREHSARLRAAKAERYARREAGLARYTHGASAYSNWGCRCPICTTAHSAKSARYKANCRARRGGGQ